MITNVIIIHPPQTKNRRVTNTFDDMIIIGHIGYFDSIWNSCAVLVLIDEIQQNDGMTVSFYSHSNRIILLIIVLKFHFYTIMENIKRKIQGRHGHDVYTHQYMFYLCFFCKETDLREPWSTNLIIYPIRSCCFYRNGFFVWNVLAFVVLTVLLEN